MLQTFNECESDENILCNDSRILCNIQFVIVCQINTFKYLNKIYLQHVRLGSYNMTADPRVEPVRCQEGVIQIQLLTRNHVKTKDVKNGSYLRDINSQISGECIGTKQTQIPQLKVFRKKRSCNQRVCYLRGIFP